MPLDNPSLDKHGRVRVSKVSLVGVADIRPVTLGERIRRYARTPQFVQDQYASEGFDEDDLLTDPHEIPMSPHEDRAMELVQRVKQRKIEEREAEKKRRIDAEKEEKDAFRRRFEELRSEGEQISLFPDSAE